MRKVNRKAAVLALGICLAVLLVAPVHSLAGTKAFDGTLTGGAEFGFVAKIKHGKPKKVGNIAWADLAVTCKEGTSNVSGGFADTLPVKHRRFEGKFTGDRGVKVSVSGKFAKKPKRASGQLVIEGGGDKCYIGNPDNPGLGWTVTRL